jgi:hypothetical protein
VKVLELKGFKSLRAFNAFHALMLGLKMLPSYAAIPYEEFFQTLDKLPLAEKESLIREAAKLVSLEKEEVESILSFCADANGVPYSSENMKSLGPVEMYEMIVAVSLEIAKIKINLVSDSEKKN